MKIIKILLFVLIAALIAFVILGSVSGGAFMNIIPVGNCAVTGEDDDMYSIGGGKTAAAGIRNIDITWTSGKVIIKAGSGSEITYDEEGASKDDERMRSMVSGNNLTIKYSRAMNASSWYSSVFSSSKTLTVTLPSSAMKNLDSITVNAVSADTDISGITAARCTVEAVSGKISIEDSVFTELHTENVSGNTELHGEFGQFSCETVSGTASVRDRIMPERASFNSVSGSMELLIPDSGFTATFDTTSGAFSSSYTVSVSGKAYLYGDGAATLSFKTVSGNADIKRY